MGDHEGGGRFLERMGKVLGLNTCAKGGRHGMGGSKCGACYGLAFKHIAKNLDRRSRLVAREHRGDNELTSASQDLHETY